MRIEPPRISPEKQAAQEVRSAKVAKTVALIIAFVSTFVFFFKLLFF
ncbi:MAG: hypothetical protein J0I41_22995 [Filimonas sp.]|nr:hypothetical protein [Filimonas sp.]